MWPSPDSLGVKPAAYNERRCIVTIPRAPLIRLVLFLIGAAASLAIAIAAGSAATGMIGGVRPIAAMALISALASAAMLLVTAGLLHMEGVSISALGLPLDRRRVGELVAGFVLTAMLFLAVAAIQSAMVGATWQFRGVSGLFGALADLPLVLCLVLAEELLFRGSVLRSLRAIAGDRWAIALTALAFGAYHVIGSQNWAMGLAFQFLMPTLGGLLFAWAAVRSGGLALPIGLHLGGNWVQASVAVFAPHTIPGGGEAAAGLWRIPISASDVQVLTAPDLLPRLPLLLAFAIAAALTWRWLRRSPDAQLLAAPKQ
jgi:membrane protease YdiL (CAAX protease family)